MGPVACGKLAPVTVARTAPVSHRLPEHCDVDDKVVSVVDASP